MTRPDEVPPQVARRVLCFLNAVETPEELAAAVEIPGETDIGVRLARRVLARRDELGGFAALEQVADVPLIGPERFGELVRALGECRLARALEAGAAGEGAVGPELRAEVARLRGLVEGLAQALGRGDRLTLRAVAARPYFGQRVTVAARLTDATGREPRLDAPVTFVAAWGRLRSEGGLTPQAGDTVTARTGADGTARVTLLPPAAEDLTSEQEQALEALLSALDPAAGAPSAAAAGLREMARQYRWDAGVRFREAVDVYVRHFRSALLDTVNRWDVASVWPLTQATVLAFAAGDGAEGGEVRASAALTLRQRNWLPAFVEACDDLAREQSTLGADLRDAAGQAADRGRFLGEVHGRVQEFLEKQRGFLGERVGRRLAEAELSRFATEDLADLPLAAQVELFPALRSTAGAVAAAGGRLVAALGQTRRDLGKEIDQKVGQVDPGALAGLGDRLGALEGQLGAKADLPALSAFRAEVESRFDAKVDQMVFDDYRRAVDGRLDLKAGVSDLAALDRKLASQREADAAALEGLRREVQAQLQAKADATTLAAFQRDVDARLAAKADQASFVSFREAVNRRLDQKADASAVDTLRADVGGALAGKADAAAVAADLAALRDRTGSLDLRVNGLNASVNRLDGSVSGLLRPRSPGGSKSQGGGG